MIYAVISDVHANEAALRAVLEDAASQGAEKVICLGDTVGYGPAPAAALALVREHCCAVLAGNHDDAVCGRIGAEDFIDLAGEAVERHREELSTGDLKYLGSLPYIYEGDGFLAAHGDLTVPEKFFYVDDEDDARANFAQNDAALMFVGHTHVPKLSLTGKSGAVYVVDAQDFTMEPSKRYIVNPGSVGYPRERGGKCMSSYVLYDSDEKTVVFRFLPFNVATVLQRGGRRKSGRTAFWLASLSVIAAVCMSLSFLLSPGGQTSETDDSLFVDSAVLDVSSMENVSANLKLARTSCPLQLSITFRNSAGQPLGEERLTVRRSSMKGFKVPDGAVSALFALTKNAEGDMPQITSFCPAKAE